MVESQTTRWLLRLGAGLTLAFIYVPLFVIAIYAFNENISQTWPIEQYTTKWFRHRLGGRRAFATLSGCR